jgi:hypothetical protein
VNQLLNPSPILRLVLDNEARPPAPGRDPCVRCGTRGDVGCTHRAPCEPLEASDVHPVGPGVPPSNVFRGRFSAEEDAQLRHLKAAGLREVEIAAAMRRTPSSISTRWSLLGRLERAAAAEARRRSA